MSIKRKRAIMAQERILKQPKDTNSYTVPKQVHKKSSTNSPPESAHLPVGKYKAIPINEIEDLSYLEWAAKELKLSPGIEKQVYERIQSLYLTHR